jgi:hypothetical protein
MLRILNAIFWIWLSFSNVLLPVASEGSEFWFSKAMQLFAVNQYLFSDPAHFAIRSVIPLILWYLVDRWLSRCNAR